MYQKPKPLIYVVCLAAYNARILHGQWIPAAQDADSLHKEVQELLKQSPEPLAEEWAIHDYEGFGEIRIDE
jgi:antirestriction protein